MNLLNYDASAVGNHEFNYGLDFFLRATGGAKYPYVSANIFRVSQDRANAPTLVRPYVILDREFTDENGTKQKLRVGVIGFTPPQIMKWDFTNLNGKVFTIDIVEAAERFVPRMKAEGADIVIAAVHSGMSPRPRQGMDENAANYLANVTGIDAILSGHLHRVFPTRALRISPRSIWLKERLTAFLLSCPVWGSNLGVVDLRLRRGANGWQRIEGTGTTRSVRKSVNNELVAAVEPESAIEAAARTEHAGTLDYIRRPVARTNSPINSFFALVQDDPSVQIVSRAQRDYVKAMLANTPHANLPVLSASSPFKGGRTRWPELLHRRAGRQYCDQECCGSLSLSQHGTCGARNGRRQVREWLEKSAVAFNRIDPAITTPQLRLSTMLSQPTTSTLWEA